MAKSNSSFSFMQKRVLLAVLLIFLIVMVLTHSRTIVFAGHDDQTRRIAGNTYQNIDGKWYLWDGYEHWEVAPGQFYLYCDINSLRNDHVNALSDRVTNASIRDTIVNRALLVTYSRDEDPIDVLERALALNWVSYVEVVYYVKYSQDPDDEYFDEEEEGDSCQIWLDDPDNTNDINAPEAWDIETGDSTVLVAIVDGGFYYNHPDLGPNIWQNLGEDKNNNGSTLLYNDQTGLWEMDDEDYDDQNPENGGDINGVDDDGNGYIDDLIGWDVADSSYDVGVGWGMLSTHGTSILGVIGARTNNGIGVAGIAGGWGSGRANKGVSLIPMSIEGDERATNETLRSAYLYARSAGASIISCSVDCAYTDETIRTFVIECANEFGILFCIAAGNDGDDERNYFDEDGVLFVGSSWDSSRCAFSNYGSNLSLTAPSPAIVPPQGVLTTWCQDLFQPPRSVFYHYGGQTSCAAPQVAGVAALLKSRFGTLTNIDLEMIICTTARYFYSEGVDSSEEDYGLWNKYTGYGQLDAHAALSFDEKHSIALVSGWNLFSSPRKPNQTDTVFFNAVSEGLGGIDHMKYAYTSWNDPVITTTTEYFYPHPDSICELAPWDPLKAYKIKTNQADTLHIIGLDVLEPDTCLPFLFTPIETRNFYLYTT